MFRQKKNWKKQLAVLFVGILEVIEKKCRIRIRNPVVLIRRSGSVSKRHVSGALLKRKTRVECVLT
jgi:hypothetical protein